MGRDGVRAVKSVSCLQVHLCTGQLVSAAAEIRLEYYWYDLDGAWHC